MGHRVRIHPPHSTPLFLFPLDGNLVLLSLSPQTILLSRNDLILSGAPETYLDSILGAICIIVTSPRGDADGVTVRPSVEALPGV